MILGTVLVALAAAPGLILGGYALVVAVLKALDPPEASRV